MAKAIVVLNDGSTYTDLTGCCILVISDEAYDLLGNTIADPGDIPIDFIHMEIKLDDMTARKV